MKTALLTILAGIYFLAGNKPGLAQSSVKTLVMTPRLTRRLIDSVDHSLQRYYTISRDWCTLNEQVQLEFLKRTGGGFSGLKMHWRDGREIPVDKSK